MFKNNKRRPTKNAVLLITYRKYLLRLILWDIHHNLHLVIFKQKVIFNN